MRVHFAKVPVFDGAQAEDELNRFLAQHRVLAIERQWIPDGRASEWALCVTYLEHDAPSAELSRKNARLDYRELLPPEQFELFAKLRARRKMLAERDAVPAYALFTNEQLAAIVTEGVRSVAALGEIPGVRAVRVQKYGAAFLEILRAAPSTNPDPKPRRIDAPCFRERVLPMPSCK